MANTWPQSAGPKGPKGPGPMSWAQGRAQGTRARARPWARARALGPRPLGPGPALRAFGPRPLWPCIGHVWTCFLIFLLMSHVLLCAAASGGIFLKKKGVCLNKRAP